MKNYYNQLCLILFLFSSQNLFCNFTIGVKNYGDTNIYISYVHHNAKLIKGWQKIKPCQTWFFCGDVVINNSTCGEISEYSLSAFYIDKNGVKREYILQQPKSYSVYNGDIIIKNQELFFSVPEENFKIKSNPNSQDYGTLKCNYSVFVRPSTSYDCLAGGNNHYITVNPNKNNLSNRELKQTEIVEITEEKSGLPPNKSENAIYEKKIKDEFGLYVYKSPNKIGNISVPSYTLSMPSELSGKVHYSKIKNCIKIDIIERCYQYNLKNPPIVKMPSSGTYFTITYVYFSNDKGEKANLKNIYFALKRICEERFVKLI